MKNRKTLDRLKENEWHAFLQDAAKKEANFYNDVAVSRFNRKM
jgi:hypothetical protein